MSTKPKKTQALCRWKSCPNIYVYDENNMPEGWRFVYVYRSSDARGRCPGAGHEDPALSGARQCAGGQLGPC